MSIKKIMIDGKRYIGLGDFDHLRHNLARDIYDYTPRDENGVYQLSEFNKGQIEAYTRIMTSIMSEEVEEAESPDEIRDMRKRIEREYLRGKYCIVSKDPETGEIFFFKTYCEYVEEGKETPVFTKLKRLAKDFDDYYVALCTKKRIESEIEEHLPLEIKPLDIVYMTKEEAERLLNAIFGKDDDEKESED